MPITVRAATPADLDALTELNRVVQGVHAGLYPDDFRPEVERSAAEAYFTARLSAPNSPLAIAEADGTPLGYILWEVQPRPATAFNPARPRLYVHHIAVAPHARHHGAEAALLRHVERQAAAAGIDGIALDLWAANDGARRFFASQGFAAFNISLRKKVSDHA